MKASVLLFNTHLAEDFSATFTSITEQAFCNELIVAIPDFPPVWRKELNGISDKIKLQILDIKPTTSVSNYTKKAIQAATGELVFMAEVGDYWLPNKMQLFVDAYREHAYDFCFSEAYIGDTEQSLMTCFGIQVKDKLAMIQGKMDQVLAYKSCVYPGIAVFKNPKHMKDIFPLVCYEHFSCEAFMAAIFAIERPEACHFIEDALVRTPELSLDQHLSHLQFENPALTTLKLQEKEAILQRKENAHFRRSHYFWFMRSLLKEKSFLKRFISINTLYLEGDYKRNTKRALQSALADLKG